MSVFTEQEVDDMSTGLVVANTPVSFASWLHRHPAVLRVSQSASADALIDETQIPKNPSERQLAVAYGALAALAKLVAVTAADNVPPVDIESLRWGRAVWSRHVNQRSTSVLTASATTAAPSGIVVSTPSVRTHSVALVDATGNPIITPVSIR